MKTEKLDSFRKYLLKRGYAGHFSEENNEVVKLYGRRYYKVEVTDINGKDIIQTFILMRSEFRTRHKRFPLWERYHQCPKGMDVEVNPAVFIASFDDEKWRVYSAGDTTNEIDNDFIVNYESAEDRFNYRLQEAKKITKSVKRLRIISITLAIILSLYTMAHIVVSIKNDGCLPLTNSFVAILCLIAFLVIFPIIFPHIKSFSANGVDVNFG